MIFFIYFVTYLNASIKIASSGIWNSNAHFTYEGNTGKIEEVRSEMLMKMFEPLNKVRMLRSLKPLRLSIS